MSEVIEALASKIKKELTHIYSDKHNSLLRGYGPSIKNFSWNSIWAEVEQNTPCLLKLLSAIILGGKKILKSTITCMILKKSTPKDGTAAASSVSDVAWKRCPQAG